MFAHLCTFICYCVSAYLKKVLPASQTMIFKVEQQLSDVCDGVFMFVLVCTLHVV